MGIGHRYVNEASHELRYWTRADSGQLPSTGSRNDRDTRGSTEANAFYIDDRIDIGNWTITPGIRYEKIDSEQKNLLKNSKDSGRHNASLPALNVIYHLTPSWNLYANTEGSFGTVQYSQMGKAVRSGDIEPEKARTWELGSRYDDGILRAELGAFLINFDNQYESNQQTDSVTARGKTRHKGIEAAIAYDLADLDPLLSGFDVYASYAYVDASIREDGPNKGNQVPFSSKHKGTLGTNYRTGAWSYNLDGSFQTSQYADNANTESESADGSTGRIAGWMVWSARHLRLRPATERPQARPGGEEPVRSPLLHPLVRRQQQGPLRRPAAHPVRTGLGRFLKEDRGSAWRNGGRSPAIIRPSRRRAWSPQARRHFQFGSLSNCFISSSRTCLEGSPYQR